MGFIRASTRFSLRSLHARHALLVDRHDQRPAVHHRHLDRDRLRPEPDDNQGGERRRGQPRQAPWPGWCTIFPGTGDGEGGGTHRSEERGRRSGGKGQGGTERFRRRRVKQGAGKVGPPSGG